MSKSQLNPTQIVQFAYDESTESIKTSLIDASLTITASSGDSIRAVAADEPSVPYDYYSQALSAADTVVTRTYRMGGAAGTVVGTTVYTYSNNTRTFLVSLART